MLSDKPFHLINPLFSVHRFLFFCFSLVVSTSCFLVGFYALQLVGPQDYRAITKTKSPLSFLLSEPLELMENENHFIESHMNGDCLIYSMFDEFFFYQTNITHTGCSLRNRTTSSTFGVCKGVDVD